MKSLIFNYSNKNKKQKPKLWIMNQFESILKQRMTQNINNVNIVHRMDYLQILIDALDNDDKLVTQNDNLHLADLNGIVLTKKLTLNVYIYI